MIRVLFSRILSLFRTSHDDAALSEEIRTHLDHLADAYRARGLSEREARAAARREFGGVDQITETYRDQRTIPFVDVFRQDVGYALRTFRRSPTYTLAAVLTLTLGIGATTAIFSVVDAVLLRPLPYPGIDRIVGLGSANPSVCCSQTGAVFHYAKARVTAFEQVAAFRGGGSGWNLVAEGAAEYVRGLAVSAGYFATFGVTPLLGREFTDAEDLPNGPRAVILSDAVWRRQFDARTTAIGEVVRLGGTPYTVVGVAPASFRSIPTADVWTPLRVSPRDGGLNYLVVGRLRADRSAIAANAELDALKPAMTEDVLTANRTSAQRVAALAWIPYQTVVAQYRRYPLLMLLGAVGFLLLMTCANVAGLQVVRALARRREMATRAALGGGTARAVVQMFIESMLLGLSGAIGGVTFAAICLRGILPFVDEGFLAGQTVAIDWRVLGLTSLVSLAVAAAVGLWPAIETARIDVRTALADAGARGTATRTTVWARRTLVFLEVAVACVLLTGAAVFGRALLSMTAADLGFEPRGVLVAPMSLQAAETPGGQPLASFYERTLERLRTLPGVESAAVGITVPVARAWNLPIEPAGRIDAMRGVDWQYVTPQYFTVFRIPLRAGRQFTDRDSAAAPTSAIVNEAFARAYFGSSGAAIGQTIQIVKALAGDVPRQIVGVVGDVKAGSGSGWTRGHALTAPAAPAVYFPAAQTPPAIVALVHNSAPITWILRLSDSAAVSAVPEIQRVMHSVAPNLPFIRFTTMNDVIGESVELQRVLTMLFGLFAAIALMLTSVGIYGLVAYGVAQRTREIGIRVALGATSVSVLRRFLTESVALSLAGAGIGLAASAMLARLLGVVAPIVLGISPRDPLTFAIVAVVLMMVATIAGFVPARRASRIDPMRALRQD